MGRRVNNCCCCDCREKQNYIPVVPPPIPFGVTAPNVSESVGFAPIYTDPTSVTYVPGIGENHVVDNSVYEEEAEDEDIPRAPVVVVPLPPDPPVVNPVAFTPSFSRLTGFGGTSCIESMTAVTRNKGYHHGIYQPGTWLNGLNFPTWDGVPISNLCTKTASEIKSFVFPSGVWAMRGLKQLWDAQPPFADLNYPTPYEIELWNIRVINHYRALLGVSNLVSSDPDLYLRAQWSNEMRETDVWDADYPADVCPPNPDEHCGASFVPSLAHQTAYFTQPGQSEVVHVSGAEGIFSQSNIDWPWSVRMSRIINDVLAANGINAHGGPFVGRATVGYAFVCYGTYTKVRMKWGGSLTHPCT